MKPVRTRAMTHGIGAPHGMEADVGLLPVECADVNGTPVLYSVWELSDHERAVIAAGGNIKLGILGGGMPPVTVGISTATRENGEIIE